MEKTRFVLLNLKTYGVKCLGEPIEVQFANKTIDDSYGNRPLIKAIYGTNGEGKTAIAHTLDIYKNTVLNTNYLRAESYIGGFKELINQRVKKVCIDLYFAKVDGTKTRDVFHHVIEFVLNDKELTVCHEFLSMVQGQTWGNVENENKVFETRDGKFIYLCDGILDLKESIENETKNLLTFTSALFPLILYSSHLETERKKALTSKEISFFYPILNALLFAIRINVYIDKKDQHYESYERVYSLLDKINKEKTDNVEQKMLIDNEIDEIDSKSFKEYEKEIKRVFEFIKIFKPSLKDIKIDKTVNRDKYYCKKILVYPGEKKDIEVSSEFESSGVKKLITLFPYLNSVEKGEIVFIDEFDSNIHDVYLCKLIEYFISFANGQLIFTTHNLGPMELLDEYKMKHSIDFINCGKITSWKRNGNYSVVNLYRNGMIPNSPFNISSVDFVKVFGGEKKNG